MVKFIHRKSGAHADLPAKHDKAFSTGSSRSQINAPERVIKKPNKTPPGGSSIRKAYQRYQ
jgi:hypothetical protein